MSCAVVLLGTVAMLAFCAGAARATTAPGQSAKIGVKIEDTAIVVRNDAQLPRGVVATFTVVNEAKEAHNFVLLGRHTPTLRPGAKASFTVTLVRRGIFPYSSSVNPSKRLRGNFIVY